MSYIDRINRVLSPDVRDGYSYFGEWVIRSAVIVSTREDGDGVTHYQVEITDKDNRAWRVELRYSDFYNSMKWLEIYDKHHHLPDVDFPKKDLNGGLFWHKSPSPAQLKKRKDGLNVWLKSRVNFCTNSHARVAVRIQSEMNYLLKTKENLEAFARQYQTQYVVTPPPVHAFAPTDYYCSTQSGAKQSYSAPTDQSAAPSAPPLDTTHRHGPGYNNVPLYHDGHTNCTPAPAPVTSIAYPISNDSGAGTEHVVADAVIIQPDRTTGGA